MKKVYLVFVLVLYFILSCKTTNIISNNSKKKSKIEIPPNIDEFSYKPQNSDNNGNILDEDIGDIQYDINEKKSNEDNKKKYYTQNNYSNRNKIDTNDLYTANMENLKIKENSLKKIEVEENQIFSISLQYPGWILKKITPDLINLLRRDNKSNSTVFKFEANVASDVNIIFLRYDDAKDLVYRQTYLVAVVPESSFTIEENNNKENDNDKYEKVFYDSDLVNNKKAENNKENMSKNDKKQMTEEDNYRKDIANMNYANQKYDEARELFLQLIRDGKQDPEILYKMGMIEKIRGDLKKSNDFFKSVLNEKDDLYYYKALFELMNNLKTQNKYFDAIDYFYKYGSADKVDLESAEKLNLLLADIYYNMKDYENAAKEYRRYIKRFPGTVDYDKALFYLAYSMENYKINPDFKEAHRIYNIIIDEYPESRFYNLSKKRILHLERHYLKIN